MFGFFKRKRRAKEALDFLMPPQQEISADEMTFLRNVLALLPAENSHLIAQVDPAFLISKRVNNLGQPGSFTFAMDQSAAKKLKKKRKGYIIVKGLSVYNTTKDIFEGMEFDIIDEILSGYYLPDNFANYNLNRVETDFASPEIKSNPDELELRQIVGAEILKKLPDYFNLDNIMRIDLDNDAYYAVHDFEDGNYFAVRSDGELFGLFHDPFMIDPVFDNIDDFFTAVKNGSFSLEEY